ncbi:hypothetical protein LEP1GSC120_2337 [Leptospira santarosai str. 200702252]|nr:hypothetical protein LEP1GSC040_1976 [Leptospira santarosai str. 2000030832]EMO71761.1 hypothetical protein LEP1GSC130_1826 [Leptospira santarosai str. 200403458]EMO99478.1 hypothetical protein LEP1GSC120_2337 [Leptospira santarosai str. 200702252]
MSTGSGSNLSRCAYKFPKVPNKKKPVKIFCIILTPYHSFASR